MSVAGFSPIGAQRYTLDDKNRVRVPAEIFAKFSDEDIVLAPGVQGTLNMMTKETYFKKLGFLAESEYLNADVQREYTSVSALSTVVERDTQNRIVIPKEIKNAYEIKKEVVFIAKYDFVEIWPAEKFDGRPAIFGSDAISMAMKNLGELLKKSRAEQ